MRHTRLARWQWFAVVSAAAGMLALLVFLIQVGLSEAVAISTVLSLFVAIAAVLVAGAVCLEAGRRFRADNKDSRQDQEGGQGVGASGTRYPQGNAGAAGTVGWGNRTAGHSSCHLFLRQFAQVLGLVAMVGCGCGGVCGICC